MQMNFPETLPGSLLESFLLWTNKVAGLRQSCKKRRAMGCGGPVLMWVHVVCSHAAKSSQTLERKCEMNIQLRANSSGGTHLCHCPV